MTVENDFIYELPFEPGERFRVTQGYGGAYSHTGDAHFSTDFRMPERTSICAARSGIVYGVVDHFEENGTHPSFKPKANAIDVLHVDDTIASYVHLINGGAIVRAGQFVSIGQPIGLSGNTGWSGRPHLHFHVADALYHKRIPTKFNSVEHGPVTVEANKWYTRPVPDGPQATKIRQADNQNESQNRDAFAFSTELLTRKDELVDALSDAGFDMMANYSSVDALHDVHGLEVCGIQSPDEALQITRLLLRQFPGWNAGWLHSPDSSSEQGWVARIQRDRDLVMEYWDVD